MFDNTQMIEAEMKKRELYEAGQQIGVALATNTPDDARCEIAIVIKDLYLSSDFPYSLGQGMLHGYNYEDPVSVLEAQRKVIQ